MISDALLGYRPPIVRTGSLDCPLIGEVDVLIVGGSPSGVAAAVSCARAFSFLEKSSPEKSARKVWLVEQNTYLGGQSVTCMVTQWEIPAFRLNMGKWQIKGMGYEMIERIVSMGGSDRLWEDLLSLEGKSGAEWPYLGPDHKIQGEEALNVEAIKYALLELCEQAGVQLLLDTRAVAPVSASSVDNTHNLPQRGLHLLLGSVEPQPILDQAAGVVVEHARGRGTILAKVIVDATANGLFSWWLGGSPGNEPDRDDPPGNWGNKGCRIRPETKRGLVQSYVWVGGVDMSRWTRWIVDQFPFERYELYPNNPDQFQKHVKTGRLVFIKTKKSAVGQPEEMWNAADEEEDLDCLFKSKSPFVGFYAKWCGNYPGHGQFALDGPYYRWESLHGGKWSEMHARNLHGSWGLFRVMRHMPGWENAYLARTVERMGLRTTRIPNGIYRISGDDLRDHAEKPDVIGVGDWHDVSFESDQGKGGIWGYHLPLRSLVSNVIDGLLFCGRAVSFEDAAMNAHRGIGTTVVCGQGAGVAAATSVFQGVQPRYVDYKQVQEILREQDVIFEIPTAH